MKIYFTCSTADFFKYRDSYFGIRNFLISNGHTLTRDWLPHTEKALKEGRIDIAFNIKKLSRLYKINKRGGSCNY